MPPLRRSPQMFLKTPMVQSCPVIVSAISPDIASDIAAIGSFVASRGWVPATAGNFSCRIDADTIAVTRSGIDKGNIQPTDLIAVSLDGPLPAGVSAETPLHVARYCADVSVGAIVH